MINMDKKFLIIVSMTLICSFGQPIYAVNCGGEEYIDSSGVFWNKDQGYKGGLSIHPGRNKIVKYTNDPAIYQTERHSSDNFSYNIRLPTPGSYILILKFAEFWSSNANKTFSIGIGQNIVINSLEIYENVKDSAAYDVFIPLIITEDVVFWNNTPLANAIENEKIIVNFIKAKSNPKVSGIMLFKGKLENTDYYEQERRIKHHKKLFQHKLEIDEKFIQNQLEKEKIFDNWETFDGVYVIKNYPVTLFLTSILFYILFQKLMPKAKW
ncbi:unnamed protein product [Blepharisma stoltei]|uniref:Malectin domain-containing protein n=1 Tax=Blepharisma stoltei TaxID=1481888 RepID=A0AAU9JXT8_9CILI|nr:unnamed protein product [Blepharisma stoltei]